MTLPLILSLCVYVCVCVCLNICSDIVWSSQQQQKATMNTNIINVDDRNCDFPICDGFRKVEI